MIAHTIILTGERGIGKSTVCRETVSLARERAYTCGGLITLSQPGDRLDLFDVRSGNTHQLTLEGDAERAILQGRFRFDPQALAWGNRVLAHATPCHLFVADEVGPLELEQKEGLIKAFDVLLIGNYRLGLVVIRPELIIAAQLRLQSSATTVLTVTADNRDHLPAALMETLGREIQGGRA